MWRAKTLPGDAKGVGNQLPRKEGDQEGGGGEWVPRGVMGKRGRAKNSRWVAPERNFVAIKHCLCFMHHWLGLLISRVD